MKNFTQILCYTKKGIFLVFCIILSSTIAFAQPTTIKYTSAGSSVFEVPLGITEITVECWGAGGGGTFRNANGLGGGGGGGAYVKSTLTVTPGEVLSLSVGSGGSGGTGTNNGQDSWFKSTSTVLAKGGSGAVNNDPNGALGGQASASIGDLKFNGGDGGTGSGTASGGGGGAAGETDNGGSGSAPTAGIGISPGGNGGAGRSGSQGNGTAGSAYGGGGGGAYRTSMSNRSGGNGAIGAVFVTYIIPSCAGEPDVTTVDNVEICPGFSLE